MGGLEAVLLLVAAPLGAAALLALPLIGGRRGARDGLTLGAVALAGLGLIGLVAAYPVVGQAARFEVGVGAFDPAEPTAAVAWTLGPVAIALVFVAVAARTRARLLVGLALVHLTVELGAAAAQLAARSAEAPGRGALVVDPLALTLLAVSVLVGGLVVVYALGYEPSHLIHRGLPPRRSGLFAAWLLVFVASMDLLVLADDFRVVVVGWEMTTLCSVMLIAFEGDGTAVAAGRRALAYGLAGSIALGSAEWLAGPNARLSLVVAGGVGGGGDPAVVPLVLAGAIVAAATKSALVPFHPWLLGAMVAAAPVSALLHASAMVNAGSYLLMRLAPAIAGNGLLGPVVTVLGAFSFAAAAVAALRQRDLKRVLAFSTVSTLGLTAASAGLGSATALAAGLLLLVFHAVAKALAFLSVGAIEQATGTRDLEGLVGGLRTAPRLVGPLAIAAAALALPPFGLVVAKWAVLELAARDIVLVVLLALGGAAYLALWTAVVARLLVRRSVASAPAGSTTPSAAGEPGTATPAAGAPTAPLALRETVPILALAIASIGTFLVAAPLAQAVADPAGRLAFGDGAGLAAGWSVALASGSFQVPAVGVLLLLALGAGVLAARRVRGAVPAPYLSGAGIAGGPDVAFRGRAGLARIARSGGFYWGGEQVAWGGVGGAGGVPTGGLGRTADIAGWVLVALVIVAASLVVLGFRTPG